MTINELVITIMIFFIVVVAFFAFGLIKCAGRKAPHPDEPYACNGGEDREEE